jgi:hypothetical protein
MDVLFADAFYSEIIHSNIIHDEAEIDWSGNNVAPRKTIFLQYHTQYCS